jgi:hypothetical protein
MLSANELGDVADWYLLPKGDIRSSYALEVAANKYTELPPPPFPLFERYCLANLGPDRVRLAAFEQIFGANQQVRPGGLRIERAGRTGLSELDTQGSGRGLAPQKEPSFMLSSWVVMVVRGAA